jgi:predicted RNA-binding protein with PUA-like domain
MPKQHWLVKQEPDAYAWAKFVADGRTAWTGVRNFTARLNLRAMKVGDRVLYYHSVTGKEVVGLAKVVREAYPDPTAKEGDWSCVDLAPVKPLKQPVTLETLKTDAMTKDMIFIRQSRLSVSPVTEKQFARILELGGTKV